MKKIVTIVILMLLFGILLLPPIAGTQNEFKVESASLFIDPEAPEPPTITGPSEGELNVLYTYEIITEDPQCDNICYTVISSDMPVVYRSHFCVSGTVVTYNHSWDDYYQKEAPFYIKARAVDCHGHISDWSYFEVTIPKHKSMNKCLLNELLYRFPILRSLIFE